MLSAEHRRSQGSIENIWQYMQSAKYGNVICHAVWQMEGRITVLPRARSSVMYRITPQYMCTTELCVAAKAVTCVKWSGRTILRTVDTCHNLQKSKAPTSMSGKAVLEHELIPAGSHSEVPLSFKKYQWKKRLSWQLIN